MPKMKRHYRRRYLYLHRPHSIQFIRRLIVMVFVLVLIMGALHTGGLLRELSGQMALSDAKDSAIDVVNEAMLLMMSRGNYDYDYFVDLGVGSDGQVTSLNANMSRINALSNRVLRDVVNASESGVLDISIPLGNLLGLNLMLGRGPDVPVKIVTLTSSYADFRNDLVSVGINQTKHQIILEVVVEIDILIPFQTITAEVVSEILIGETIIMGEVPETYLSME